MSELRSLVDRQRQAFNAHDFDAWSELFDPDVEVMMDGTWLHGLAAVRAYAETVLPESRRSCTSSRPLTVMRARVLSLSTAQSIASMCDLQR